MFYKVIKDNSIVDALNDILYIKVQKPFNRTIFCIKSLSQGILSSDGKNIWFVNDLILENVNNYPVVELIEIDEEEYNVLSNALLSNESIEIIEDVVEEQPEEDEPTEEELNTVAFVKSAKIKEMKNTCRLQIEKGVDAILSDGDTYHFSLSTQDQLNLSTLYVMVASGETSIPYHADGESCKYYSAEDISTIISTARKHITYHTTYYNSLKAYISSLRSIKTIGVVEYGCDIPEKYQSEVLQELLAEE